LVTITAQTPEILSLPWELLHDAGQFLFAFQPSITILRRIPAKTRFPIYASQSHLHILFLISRPKDESFLDPRADAQAVLKAIENYSAITVEFLQPPTLENLWQRLQNSELPTIDVIHFDGHGVFDKTGEHERRTIEQLSSISRNLRKKLRDLEIGANTGYLLFEQTGKYGQDRRDKFLVPTSWLNLMLSEAKVRLMVLSACQSAMVVHDDKETEEEPIGSIAVGLVKESVPSVLAMSYSVMAQATKLLFGEFYREIAAGENVGMALDKARLALLRNRKRRDLQRGPEQVAIQVSDWFLPTLYQASEDSPLVSKMTPESPQLLPHNLPNLPKAGFWGRSKELWQIDNGFSDGIRRVVVSGFSGQGKTFLAQELGRWFLQIKRFDAVVFVDYSGYQGLDAVQWAVTTLGSVVEQSLVDVAAANTVLQNKRILLILDNLEVYVSEKQDTLQELLTVAKEWSLLGETRVLITTRPVTLGHEAYQENHEKFQQLKLDGLDKEDALHYFERLLALSDNPVRLQRDELLRWFEKVQFHPLSISLLARSLETEDLANLEIRLNQLMLELPDNPVKATLQLVIEQLDEESQRLLSRLGVFQGGALEDILLGVMKLKKLEESPSIKKVRKSIEVAQSGDTQKIIEDFFGFNIKQLPKALVNALCREIEENRQFKLLIDKFSCFPKPELAQRISELTWSMLRQQLEFIGLIQPENIFGQIYLKFHPNLIFFLRLKLSSEEEATLTSRYQQHYYQLSEQLIFEDIKNPAKTRAIFQRELPNLLHAVYKVLDVGMIWAVKFGNNVSRFLNIFGFNRTQIALSQRIEKTTGKKDFEAFYGADVNRGKQLFNKGRYQQATQLFNHLLRKVKKYSYEYCTVLTHLGNCFEKQGKLIQAEKSYQEGLLITKKLKTSQSVKRQIGVLQTSLANVLKNKGHYEDSRIAYEAALNIAKEQNDIRQMTVIKGQLCSLLFVKGELEESIKYHNLLIANKHLNEPEIEATIWHNLAVLYRKKNNLNDAEEACRKSAYLKEKLADKISMVEIWNLLGTILHTAQKFEDAENWYRKALKYCKYIDVENKFLISDILHNLASLLKNKPQCLEEARQKAEKALSVKKQIDPNLAQIWKTYILLAKIVVQQNKFIQAKHYLSFARQMKANFAGTQYELQKYHKFIITIIDYVAKPKQQKAVLKLMEINGIPKELIAISRQIFSGERDLDNLCEELSNLNEELNLEFSMIVYAILEGIENPESLKWFEQD
jgi:CHAT domain-containing protein/tetratricopeptide (TPR) repeat protein